MTRKIISGAYPGGFTLTADYSGLKLTSTASVGGTGVYVTATASVMNDGSITAGTAGADVGVYLRQGGAVTNAAGGYIEGYDGVLSSFQTSVLATIVNHGTIYAANVGLEIDGGKIVNGGTTDPDARIIGDVGVALLAGRLINRGQIFGGGVAGVAVAIGPSPGFAGGASTGDLRSAPMAGATAANYGLIANYEEGVAAYVSGGTLINGSATNASATIYGSGPGASVEAVGAFGDNGALMRSTIENFGTIRAINSTGTGVYVDLAGTLTNGSASDGAALITGFTGVFLSGATATNLGTIIGGSYGFGAGVELLSGYSNNYQADMVNGAAGDTSALIRGRVGVLGEPAVGVATIDNFGTILGTGGTAVLFESNTDVLAVEAGSVFEGAVIGGGGTLDLNSGAGSFFRDVLGRRRGDGRGGLGRNDLRGFRHAHDRTDGDVRG